MNKKANLAYNWVEYLFVALLIIGFILALKVQSAAMSYIIIFLCGFITGRFAYKLKNKSAFPFYVVLLGFFLGYLLGSYYGSKSVIAFLFFVSNFLSYYLYSKGYIK